MTNWNPLMPCRKINQSKQVYTVPHVTSKSNMLHEDDGHLLLTGYFILISFSAHIILPLHI